MYVGKRKTFAKRVCSWTRDVHGGCVDIDELLQIETERITIESRTLPSTPTSPPKYELSLSYVRSSNSGKALLHRGKGQGVRGYNTFFDEEGTLDQDAFEEWVRGLVDNVTGENN